MSRQLGQVGQDGLVPDKFDITPGEIHNNSTVLIHIKFQNFEARANSNSNSKLELDDFEPSARCGEAVARLDTQATEEDRSPIGRTD